MSCAIILGMIDRNVELRKFIGSGLATMGVIVTGCVADGDYGSMIVRDGAAIRRGTSIDSAWKNSFVALVGEGGSGEGKRALQYIQSKCEVLEVRKEHRASFRKGRDVGWDWVVVLVKDPNCIPELPKPEPVSDE